MKQLIRLIHSLGREEDGAEIIEYALIIAVVTLTLTIALGALFTNSGSAFPSFINRVVACLTTTTCA